MSIQGGPPACPAVAAAAPGPQPMCGADCSCSPASRPRNWQCLAAAKQGPHNSGEAGNDDADSESSEAADIAEAVSHQPSS